MKKNIFSILVVIGLITIIPCNAQKPDELMRKASKSIELGKFTDALTLSNQALELENKSKGKSSLNYAVIIGRIGNLYYMMGDMKKAEEFYNNEINLLRDINKTSDPYYATALNDLACVYQYTGNYIEAEKLLNQAISLKKDFSKEKEMTHAVSLHNLAKLKQVQGNYEEAEKLYNQALQLKEKYAGKSGSEYATTLLNLGLLYQELGNYQDAKKNIEQAVNILESDLEKNNPQLKSAKLQLALVYASQNNNKKLNEILSGIENPEEIYQLESHPDYAPTLYNIAMLYWSQKKYSDAKRILEKALKISEKQPGKGSTVYSSCLNSLGLVCWAGKMYNEAYQYLNDAVANRAEIYGENNPKYTTALHNLAGLLSYMGRKKESEEFYLKSLNLYHNHIRDYFPFLSEKEKTSFYAMIKERYDLFNCYVLENYESNPSLIGEMYNNHIAGKAILLKDIISIRQNIKNSGNEELLKLFDKWQKNKEELSKLYNYTKLELKSMGKDLVRMEAEANQLEKELSKNSNVFVKNYLQEKPNWKDIQKQLSGDEAAVEIIRFSLFRNGWTDKIYYVALIVTNETKDNPEMLILDNNNKLESMYIKNYNNSMRFKIDDNESYKAFWSSIDEYLADKNKIYLSVDGVYNKVNIHSLKKPDGSYVIDKKEIVLVANTADIISLKNKKEFTFQDKTACLFGFPKATDINDEKNSQLKSWRALLKDFKIDELPQTKVEINEIDKLLQQNQFKTAVYMEEKANKNLFKNLGKQNLLHIATHGFFLTDFEMNNNDQLFGIDIDRFIDNPLLRSGLIFSDTENESGILTANEVKAMNFDATDLVVLSACETGAGEIKNGEGVYGLQRAFQSAGAGTVVMSLWKVDDIATQEFMSKFYEYIVQGSNPSSALKMTQMKIKEKYSHPYYWGGFVLISN